MSRVPTVFNVGDRVVWSHHDEANDIKLILTGTIIPVRTTSKPADTLLVNDIKMHSLESTKGIPADTHLQFPSPAYIPKSIIKKLSDGKWQL